jgi:hypothetical protein
MTRIFRSIGGAVLSVAALALALAPASAQAETIRFDQVQQGGTLTNTGGDIVGTNIIFEFITYDANDDGTPESIAYCDSSFSILSGSPTNCYLNFEYNPSTSTNYFTLTSSGLYDSSFNLISGTSGVILSGTFTSVSFSSGGTIFSGVGIDSKNQALLDYFGSLTTNFTFNNTEIRTENGTVTQADIVNTVPEPGLLTLFGLGLLGVGRKFARRRA